MDPATLIFLCHTVNQKYYLSKDPKSNEYCDHVPIVERWTDIPNVKKNFSCDGIGDKGPFLVCDSNGQLYVVKTK